MKVLNASSIAKPNAIEQLTADLLGYDVDIAIITETHSKRNISTAVSMLRATRCSAETDLVARVAGLQSTLGVRSVQPSGQLVPSRFLNCCG